MKFFLLILAISFCSLSAAFSILYYGLKWSFAIAILYRMFAYPHEHPFQYIGIISFVFAIVGSLWIRYYGSATGSLRWWTMSLAMLMTVLISSPLGGVLWQIHDMQHGFIPENDVIQSKIRDGISWGFADGWLIVLLSFPLNLIGLIVGYACLDRLGRLSRNRR